MGSGYGAVGRAVASNTVDPRFKSTLRQFYLLSNVLIKMRWKDENNGKGAGNGPFLIKLKIRRLNSKNLFNLF